MCVLDYPYIVFAEMKSSLINRVTLQRRGFMTIAGAKRYLDRIRSSSFCLSAWIN